MALAPTLQTLPAPRNKHTARYRWFGGLEYARPPLQRIKRVLMRNCSLMEAVIVLE
jgi:hypothetical protein